MKLNYTGKSRKWIMFVLTLIVVIDFYTIFGAAEFTAVVDTTTGPIRGEILKTINSVKYAAFKGIRYAKPPLGYLRFQPPIAIDRWSEIRDATVEGDDCTQRDYYTGVIKGSEDCLFINVHTPLTDLTSPPAKLKSVMVWIYGGSFTTGTSSDSMYNPAYIIEKDVVYISMNYRLGALGFLNLNHPNATGNAGLKDQVLALKWVQSNVKKFGGDPRNVTIFGQSAGSACVGYHVLSDASTGLFHGAISMSGVPLNPWAFQTSEKALFQAMKLSSILGTVTFDKNTLLKSLYDAPAAQIVRASSQIAMVLPAFAPTLENKSIAKDVFLSTCSLTKYNNGNYNKVPQMMGFMDKETLTYFGTVEPFVELVTYSLNAANEIGFALPPGLRIVKRLIDLGIDISSIITTFILDKLITETTNLLFVAQIDQTQKYLVNNVKPVYYYHVSFYTNRSVHNILRNNTLQGPGHSDELPYIFYMPFANYSTDLMTPVGRTIHRYSTMWTNFAKYGNPTPDWIESDLNVTWPHSGFLGTSLDIGNELTVGPRPVSGGTSRIELISRSHLASINECIKISMYELIRSIIPHP